MITSSLAETPEKENRSERLLPVPVWFCLAACAGGPVRATTEKSPSSPPLAENTARPITEPRPAPSSSAPPVVADAGPPPRSTGSDNTPPERTVACLDVRYLDRISFVGEIPYDIGAFDVKLCRGTVCERGTVDWGAVLPLPGQDHVDTVEFGVEPRVRVKLSEPREVEILATFMDNSFRDGDVWSLKLVRHSSGRVVAEKTVTPKWQDCDGKPAECYSGDCMCRGATIRF